MMRTGLGRECECCCKEKKLDKSRNLFHVPLPPSWTGTYLHVVSNLASQRGQRSFQLDARLESFSVGSFPLP